MVNVILMMARRYVALLVVVLFLTIAHALHQHGHPKKRHSLLAKRNPVKENAEAKNIASSTSNNTNLQNSKSEPNTTAKNDIDKNEKKLQSSEITNQNIKSNTSVDKSEFNTSVPNADNSTYIDGKRNNTASDNSTVDVISKFNLTKPYKTNQETNATALKQMDKSNGNVTISKNETGTSIGAITLSPLSSTSNSSLLKFERKLNSTKSNNLSLDNKVANITENETLSNSDGKLLNITQKSSSVNSSATMLNETDSNHDNKTFIDNSINLNQRLLNASAKSFNKSQTIENQSQTIENQVLRNKQNDTTSFDARKRSHDKKHGIVKHNHGRLHHKIVTSKRSKYEKIHVQERNIETTKNKDKQELIIQRRSFVFPLRKKTKTRNNEKQKKKFNIITGKKRSDDIEKAKIRKRMEEKANASKEAEVERRANEQLHRLRKMKDHFDNFVNAIDKKEKENDLRAQIKDSQIKLKEEEKLNQMNREIKHLSEENDNENKESSSLDTSKDTKDNLSKLDESTEENTDGKNEILKLKGKLKNQDEDDKDFHADDNTKEPRVNSTNDSDIHDQQASLMKSKGEYNLMSKKNQSQISLENLSASSTVNEDDVTKHNLPTIHKDETNTSKVSKKGLAGKSITNLVDHKHKVTNEALRKHSAKINHRKSLHAEVSHVKPQMTNDMRPHDYIYLNKTRAVNEKLPNNLPNTKIPLTFKSANPKNILKNHPVASNKQGNQARKRNVNNETKLNVTRKLGNQSESNIEAIQSKLNETSGNTEKNETIQSNLPSNLKPMRGKKNKNKTNDKDEQTETVFTFDGSSTNSVNNSKPEEPSDINRKRLQEMKDFLKNQHNDLNYRSMIMKPLYVARRSIEVSRKRGKNYSGKKLFS